MGTPPALLRATVLAGLLATAACDDDPSELLTTGPGVPGGGPTSGDTTAPTLVDVDFAPRRVNVVTDPELVTVVATVRDDLSGVERVSALFRTPTTETASGLVTLLPIRGDSLEGRYEGVLFVPRRAQSGAWALAYVFLEDAAGNDAMITERDLIEAGLDVTLTVDGGG